MMENVGSVLHRWAQQDPERTGIVDVGRDERRLSYGELDRQASRVAAHLLERGLGPGDRIAICTANGMDFVAAWFGAVYAGCTTLPIPVMSTSHEIAFRLQHAGCKALLTDAGRVDVARASRKRAGVDTSLLQIQEALQEASGEVAPHDVTPGSLAMLLYTSGTTGAAKAVCITHESLRMHTKALVEQTLRLTEEDRILGALPLTHSYGIRMTLLVPFYAGASTVFVPKFSAARTLDLCSTHAITWLPAVPTMFVAWARDRRKQKPSALRWCMSAGAPLPEDVRLRAEERLDAPVRQGYGLTEATFTTINAPPDVGVAGSSGKPVAGVEVRIADDFGEELPPGTHGEVLIRGQNVMAGYLNDALATAHVMRGGWLHTGDIGFADEEGRLSIADRIKDLILRGGASIYPSEVENVLARHPAVDDVAVVGQPDDYYGEEIVAVIVRHGDVTADLLDQWAREQLAPYKLPRLYAFADELPQGMSGKTLKRRLRDRLMSGDLDTEKLSPHRSAE